MGVIMVMVMILETVMIGTLIGRLVWSARRGLPTSASDAGPYLAAAPHTACQ